MPLIRASRARNLDDLDLAGIDPGGASNLLNQGLPGRLELLPPDGQRKFSRRREEVIALVAGIAHALMPVHGALGGCGMLWARVDGRRAPARVVPWTQRALAHGCQARGEAVSPQRTGDHLAARGAHAARRT